MKNHRSTTTLVPPKSARELLDMYFLDARSALLETAAIFDRIDRAEDRDALEDDQRLTLLRQACNLLSSPDPGRAEAFLKMFSEPEPNAAQGKGGKS